MLVVLGTCRLVSACDSCRDCRLRPGGVVAALMARQLPDGSSIDLAWPQGPRVYLVTNGGASSSINARAAPLDTDHDQALHGPRYRDPWACRKAAIGRCFRFRIPLPLEPTPVGRPEEPLAAQSRNRRLRETRGRRFGGRAAVVLWVPYRRSQRPLSIFAGSGSSRRAREPRPPAARTKQPLSSSHIWE